MKNFGNSSCGRSQGVPKIFRTLACRVHCAVIFAIAQLSHEFLTDFTYQNLHGFARFPGDSTALVIDLLGLLVEYSGHFSGVERVSRVSVHSSVAYPVFCFLSLITGMLLISLVTSSDVSLLGQPLY